MTESAESFLKAAALLAGSTPSLILTSMLHLDLDDNDRFAALLPGSHPEIGPLFCQLDRELRLRNPGLHYVERKMYLGYRRELADLRGGGERSQVFVSVLRSSSCLDIVMPVDPSAHADMDIVRDLSTQGHHGIGDLRCRISSPADVLLVMKRFEFWLLPAEN